METEELLNGIGVRGELKARVLAAAQALPPETQTLRLLVSRDTARSANEQLPALLGDDPDGMKMLAAHLQAALLTHGEYRRLGIDDGVYFATMACFTRFVEECVRNAGRLCFDRAWWTYRQLSCSLFRIGELEYERDRDERIFIHIPSDCDLRGEKVETSLREAKEFFQKYFPAVSVGRFYCESWLLSPALQPLLKEDSRIKAFARRFVMEKFLPEDTGFYFWLFGKEPCALDDLPQNTALQRAVKELLKEGKTVGAGAGYILTK